MDITTYSAERETERSTNHYSPTNASLSTFRNGFWSLVRVFIPNLTSRRQRYARNTCPSTGLLNSPSSNTLRRRIGRILVPSFLAEDQRQEAQKIRPTDFLDGMRGYAAFAVYCCHFIMPTHPKAHMGYGGNDGIDDYWITQLPILRLIYSGHTCVCLFFVISGFAISLRPLELARKGSYSALLDNMTSAIFRRPCRLYIPCFTILGITFFLSICGAFDFAFALTKHWPFPSRPLRIPAVHPTMSLQFKDFFGQVFDWADPLNRKTKHIPYGVQLWTIPVELRCSLVSFLTIIALAKVRPYIRLVITAGIGVYFQLQRHPEATLFLAGSILAELHIERAEHDASNLFFRIPESRVQKLRATLLFLFGLFLASYPPHGAAKALFWGPFHWLAKLIVSDSADADLYFYQTIASTLLVYVANRSPSLQKLFTTQLAVYLGKISFSLYCVHQALINWFGYRTILLMWSFTGRDSLWEYEAGIVLTFIFQTILSIWVADIFWRLVDAPSVGLTKRIERACIGGSWANANIEKPL
ncbi:hypothetical protein K491DRAFT_640255 [Lophiostoma macrostomum CBS 122681]|uniref:Acyltransferase 3 domain-containing protein n=1 Tax=Lophiostoma macrostomum CBS 122681 TaxID=1314788 RepID=A0A6A6SQ06_9PLEO|nr:hypothetical protein K491DRAFT_640255 [Lophiostoma macrostomum CBS 122681]